MNNNKTRILYYLLATVEVNLILTIFDLTYIDTCLNIEGIQ